MNETSATPLIELLAFANSRGEDDRRSSSRTSLVAPALVQPVDNTTHPLGEPIEAVTRDVSPRGIGLIFKQLPNHDLLAVQFMMEEKESYLLCAAKWHEPAGPFVFVGLDVVRKLDTFPSSGGEFSALPQVSA